MNKEQFENFLWMQSTAEKVDAFVDAKHQEDKTKAHVLPYVRPILERYAFTRPDGRPITRTEDLYLVEGQEDRILAFYSVLDEAHLAHGYRIEPGCCPVLIAEDKRIKAESALLRYAVASGILPMMPLRLEHRKKALEILVSGFYALRVA